MRVHLLDINVLVALLWTNHEQHRAASQWFESHQRDGWATCPLTQAGFVRISSNPRIFPDAPPPAKALEILRANLNHPAHHFWKDEISLAQAVAPFGGHFSGHQQTTDAYLFGLAIHKRGVLATFDTSIAALLEENSGYLKSLTILEA
jgi:toxin-antitoxin system PIN domain toxin